MRRIPEVPLCYHQPAVRKAAERVPAASDSGTGGGLRHTHLRTGELVVEHENGSRQKEHSRNHAIQHGYSFDEHALQGQVRQYTHRKPVNSTQYPFRAGHSHTFPVCEPDADKSIREVRTMEPAQVTPMKLFRLADGLQVWNGPESGGDTQFLYRENFERHCYEKHGVAINDGSVVFDAGANIGMFALSLMQRFRDLRIYCFEPVPSTYACLARNLAESPLRTEHQLVPINIGLGVADGETTIEFFPGAPSNSTLHSIEKHRDFGRILDGVRFADMWRTGKPRALLLMPLFPFRKLLLRPAMDRLMSSGVSVPCKVRTLSGIIREHRLDRIDLLKIDVEGAEMDVLAGIEETDWTIVQQLVMEVEVANKPQMATLTNRLRSLGFKRITVENMFGGACNPDDSVSCILFAVR